MELSQLHAFHSSAKYLNFSKAAEELNISPSAISQHIKHLENKLGLQLFVRSGKQLHLTKEGLHLQIATAQVLRTLEESLRELTELKDSCHGPLRLGTFSAIGKSFLNHSLMDFCKLYPQIQMEILLEDAPTLLQKFAQFELDALVLPQNRLPEGDFGQKFFMGEEVITLVAPIGLFATDAELTLEDLTPIPLIDFDPAHSLYNNWSLRTFGETPKNQTRRIQVNSHGSILYAVSIGLGMAVVPLHMLRRSFYKDQVESFNFKYSVKNQSFYLMIHPELAPLKRMQQLIHHLMEHKSHFASPLRGNPFPP